MHMSPDRTESRRTFLKFLAGSPLLALWFQAGPLENIIAEALQQSTGWSSETSVQKLIASPEQAINVFDFEALARQKLPPAHWAYMATGVDDDVTLRANHAAFSRFQIRPRRLVDVDRLDTSTEIFGVKW